MKTIHITCEWRSHHEVEVTDDYEWDGRSCDDEWADEVTSQNAELLDWEVK